ncbi:MAG TPA: tripartite tricarboxylate transporter substrate binding protein [Ideonella sp.]|uniref:Bug family tripartite tricarboxylate transporter substrate binding protein n=1 Tax=Ideonella sp. TaxID=1929293 RepID=UPI002B5F0FC8|nr:tripartite tricarboxylate transporter substrate binding protein [Ideonella sp.]HSI48037.1 tripartite tricarboxylate transporter substrate binding protein [Ideonella sp.]
MNSSALLPPSIARRALLAGLALAGLTLPAISALAADAYPSKPLQLVVPFPPGGATDVLARLVAKGLGDKLGQSIVVENRAGAGTAIGASYVAKAPADGYTLLISSGTTYTANPAINPKLGYDPLKSFEQLGIVGRTGLILLANPQVKADSPKSFVALVHPAPGKFAWASFGNGTTSHFTGELLQRATDTQMLHVPYKGSSPAMIDLIAGQVQFSVDTVAAALPQLKAGKVKAIGVTMAKRSALLPNVPSFQEQGYAIDADTWLSVAAPRGLPAAVRAKLEKALAELAGLPEVKAQMASVGFEAGFVPGAKVERIIEADLPVMRATATRANIRIE